MNNMNDPNQPYRRPRPHFSAEQDVVRATVDRRRLLMGSAVLLGLALVLILAMIPLKNASTADEGGAAQAGSSTVQVLAADCAVIQQMTYAPCQHSLVRRQALPAELAGKTLTELSAAYENWQVTGFSPAEVTMEQRLDIFCPQHTVLLPDEGGMLCIWQNKYGDALALVKELGTAVSELPEDAQDEVRRGKGFDTQEALEKWLESVES